MLVQRLKQGDSQDIIWQTGTNQCLDLLAISILAGRSSV